jgi:hypothetical protein
VERITGLSICHKSISVGLRKGHNFPLAPAPTYGIENEYCAQQVDVRLQQRRQPRHIFVLHHWRSA